jgi:glucose/arabinose dehydrogenase
MLRSFQNDAALVSDQGDEGQRPRGNHDGGVITFGKDGKLYIFIGMGKAPATKLAAFRTYRHRSRSTVPDDQFSG